MEDEFGKEKKSLFSLKGSAAQNELTQVFQARQLRGLHLSPHLMFLSPAQSSRWSDSRLQNQAARINEVQSERCEQLSHSEVQQGGLKEDE